MVSRGEMTAGSPIELRSRIQSMDLRLLSYQLNSSWLDLSQWKILLPNHWMPVRSRDIELFLHQLAIMLRSGLKLLDAIKSLQMQAERRSMARMLQQIYQSVAEGGSLSQALSAQKSIPSIVVELTNIGEQTGRLDGVLLRARDFLAQRRATISQVQMAIIYPAGVAIAAISLAVYLIVAVIPHLQVFLGSMGKQLPAMTQSLLDLSNWLKLHGINLAAGIVSSLLGLYLLYRSPGGRDWLDRWILRLPLVGKVLRLAGTTGLATALSVMLGSGIRMVDAIRIAARIQHNRFLATILRDTDRTITSGYPIAPPLAKDHGFSPILSSMVEVAERSGDMDKTLEEVSQFCASELKTRIDRMTRLIEPVVIVLAGGIVAYVYIAFFVALMSAGGNFR